MLSLSLNLLIPAAVISGCAIIAIFKFFIALRKRFSISVNCWFCNFNTRVPYINQNSFECPKCTQYNGFTEDGDYNREIQEQHYSKLNNFNNLYCEKTLTRLSASNGLCEGCNRNQEMKIIQLANFKPRCEAKYDEEIEEYRDKLEDSYQLCQQCQRTLNKTLNRVKTKFIGSKISQLVTKGIQVVVGKSNLKDRQFMSKLAMASIFILSIINLIKDTNINLDFLKSNNYYFHIVALRLTIIDLATIWFKGMDLHKLADINIDFISTTAVTINFLILFKQQQVRPQIILSMLFWSLKMVISEVPINQPYILAVNGSIAGILVLISLHMMFKSLRNLQPTLEENASFHKLHTEVIDDSDNEMDSPESTFNFDARSCKSSVVYSPSMTTFNSCLREQTLLQPAKTFPFNKNASQMFNKSLCNSTFSRQEAPSVATMDLLSNRSFSIRQEVATADRSQVHNDINKLNISGNMLGSTSTLKDFSMSRNLNPFSLENSRCGSPTPSIASVFSGSQRTQIISPPRLEPCLMREGNTSWVAGGYWSSPQKRFLEVHHFSQNAELSRSSSQSSGLGTIDSDKNSRENSIGHEDVTSMFSEPVRRRNLFDKPSSDARSLYGQSFVQAPKVNNFFLNNSTNNFRKYREANSFFK